jgi:hypothetical protein
MKRVLILGFYDRDNLGDETYKLAFGRIFPKKELIFKCIDDTEDIPVGISTVIIGGGDVINSYFMNRVERILKRYTGKVYAISVGIPYTDDLKYLNLFDHVFTRSSDEYIMASSSIGNKNVTKIDDIVTVLRAPHCSKQSNITKIGICLAQSMFYDNVFSSLLVNLITSALNSFYSWNSTTEFHLFSFNTHLASNKECDIVINKRIAPLLKGTVIQHPPLSTSEMLKELGSMTFNICSRYHSIIFSIMTCTKYIPLYCSSKIERLLKDLNFEEDYNCKMETDALFKPIQFDSNKLLYAMKRISSDPIKQYNIDLNQIKIIKSIVRRGKSKVILKQEKIISLEETLSTLESVLCKYFSLTKEEYSTLLHAHAPFHYTEEAKYFKLASLICYLITRNPSHPCVWGLSQNMKSDTFCLHEAIQYIYSEQKSILVYYPELNLTSKTYVSIDPYFSNNFSDYHRSGWGYVVGGLMNLDASYRLKDANIIVDTYVDRTFHWAFESLKVKELIPYKSPWCGFIHHTFDTQHSSYNCVQLFKNQIFLESLNYCKGLITLSVYLSNQIKKSLMELKKSIPVYTLYHPTEFIDSLFTIKRYLANKDKKLIGIGAWLRDPYALYEVRCDLNKVALKGKDMDQYIPPSDFLESLRNLCFLNKETTIPSICRGCISRGGVECNKFCEGLYNSIERNISSVSIISKVNNEEYDLLLSENIVFLYLIDCSAVNTVIECIVRHTPLIVNRHPALEEILGLNYPGFYSTLVEVPDLCKTKKIKQIHTYLKKLNKEQFRLSSFVTQFQSILSMICT